MAEVPAPGTYIMVPSPPPHTGYRAKLLTLGCPVTTGSSRSPMDEAAQRCSRCPHHSEDPQYRQHILHLMPPGHAGSCGSTAVTTSEVYIRGSPRDKRHRMQLLIPADGSPIQPSAGCRHGMGGMGRLHAALPGRCDTLHNWRHTLARHPPHRPSYQYIARSTMGWGPNTRGELQVPDSDWGVFIGIPSVQNSDWGVA